MMFRLQPLIKFQYYSSPQNSDNGIKIQYKGPTKVVQNWKINTNVLMTN